MPSRANVNAIRQALSPARLSTFEQHQVAPGKQLTQEEALQLYTWNVQVSSALLNPLHICEVAIRNTVAEAIETRFGPRWPWSSGFERSLPNPQRGYNPRRNLQDARSNQQTTGKVIPELNFVFWQRMFTSRFDQRIWQNQIQTLFPNAPSHATESQIRNMAYSELDKIRGLRNRIAHHEPIFSRNLLDDFQRIEELIRWRCDETANWMLRNQQAKKLIQARPDFSASYLKRTTSWFRIGS